MRIVRHSLLALALASGIVPCMIALTGEDVATSATAGTVATAPGTHHIESDHTREKHQVKKVLLVGDSMTGWMGERLEAYGHQNGFEVATVVWDGSTIPKWGNSAERLKQIVAQQKPDVVFVSLGLNELLEKNPATRYGAAFEKIRHAVGNLPMVWIGPPSWPGKPGGEILNSWLAKQMGEGGYFRSLDLKLPRQSTTNPHPSRDGINKWIDALVQWLPDNTDLQFPGLAKPTGPQTVRGKNFIYRKMKQSL